MPVLSHNLNIVNENIRLACEKSGRQVKDITLVAVTKTVEIQRISELVNLGVRELGENKVQELMEKHPAISEDVNWHLIGHLQTNKVKYIADKVKLIHSVESIKLAEQIDRCSKNLSKTTDILVEINIAAEKSKYGIEPEGLENFLQDIASFNNIMVKGLMCVAPYVENPEENRDYFRKMRRMFVDTAINSLNNIDMLYLSMGMTNDYAVAIEEGSNIIRIGTGIFGERY